MPSHVPYLNTHKPCPEHLLLEPPPGGLNVVVWHLTLLISLCIAIRAPFDCLMPLFTDLIELGLINLHPCSLVKMPSSLTRGLI